MKRTLFVMALAIANVAIAQQPAGDLAGKVAQKLSKDEVLKLLSGANTSGVNAAGNRYTMEYKNDGSLAGYMYLKNSRSQDVTRGMEGTWTVNNDGQICRNFRVMAAKITEVKNCLFVLRIDDGRVAYSDSAELGSKATVFEIKR